MQRVQAAKDRATQLIRDTVGQAGELAQRFAVRLADKIAQRGSELRHGETGQFVAESVLKAGAQVIDASPVPVPVVVRDTLGKMQDALGQLGNAIEAVDAGASADAAKDVAKFKHQVKGGAQHFTGQLNEQHTFTERGGKHKHGQRKHDKV